MVLGICTAEHSHQQHSQVTVSTYLFRLSKLISETYIMILCNSQSQLSIFHVANALVDVVIWRPAACVKGQAK